MVQQSPAFNAFVIKGILHDNNFDICNVNELASIRSLVFRVEDYKQIEQFVEEEKFELIKDLTGNSSPREYLEIMRFTDQNGNRYIVTVYDSDELWQDPEIIKIYPSRL